jgi:dipeptidyl aminopeptidase/acylaminoacyl peptidase
MGAMARCIVRRPATPIERTIMRLPGVVSAFVLFALSGRVFANESPPPIEAFFKRDAFVQLEISPDGAHLAASVPLEDKTILVILDRATMQVTGHMAFEAKAHVDQFAWVANDRVIASAAKREGRLASPQSIPGLFQLSVDGSKQGEVIGYPAAVLSGMADSDDQIIIQYSAPEGPQALGRVRLSNGAMRRITPEAPINNAQFYLDNADVPRLLVGRRNNERESRFYLSDDEGTTWDLLDDANMTRANVSVLGFSADNTRAFLSVERDSGPDAVELLDLASRERKEILRDDNVDPFGVLKSFADHGVYAVTFRDGETRVEFTDAEHPEAKDLKRMQAAFPDAVVLPVSGTSDAKLVIYLVSSDTINGDYYLYDRSTGQAAVLAQRSVLLDPSKLAKTEAIRFKGRDGLEMEAFLTLPRGVEGKLPMVVVPHGGPIGVFDTAAYDAEVQLLASRGYAVLRPNFRGSGNYGRRFLVSGYGGWGTTMQDDVTDATRHVLAQGQIDPKRVCIYGASYGAYAALMGAVREPELYRCAVGNVGVYDLPTLLSEDGTSNWTDEEYLGQMIGTSDLATRSPNRRANEVRVPVLLAAGELDLVAPPKQTRMMERALRDAGGQVDTVIYPREAHGNYLIANQVDWGKRVLEFLDRHIGP